MAKLSANSWITLFIVATIFAACLMMAGPMRPGLPVSGELVQRLAYIQQKRLLWQLGWGLWMASALGLLLFATLLCQYLPRGTLRRYGYTLLALGIAPDLIAEMIYSFIIPNPRQFGLATLAGLEIIAVHLTGFLGNGLYNLGGLLLNIALLRALPQQRWIAWCGLPAWLFGLGLSAAIAAGDYRAAELLTGIAMVLSTLWMLLLALTLFQHPPSTTP